MPSMTDNNPDRSMRIFLSFKIQEGELMCTKLHGVNYLIRIHQVIWSNCIPRRCVKQYS